MTAGALLLPLLLAASLALAAPPATASATGPAWASLTAQQQQVLAPLKKDWASIEAHRRLKWLEVAARYPKLPADEQQRLQARMTEWARMTPAERSAARQQFQEVRNLPEEERRARWAAYQALAPEERARLANKAAPGAQAAPDGARSGVADALASNSSHAKRNIVPISPPAVTKTGTPGVQHARPGATTTPITARAAPPAHHQTGLPKIAATPGFVDKATLLPQRGPQGAAVRAASAPEKPEKP